jgi:multiple antibiotic resistance protein
MSWSTDNAVLMFVALVTLYSPLAALPSYAPIIGGFTHKQQARLALGLFFYVSVFVLAGLWAGEVLLELLGITTAALTATGGIALLYESVPLMRGEHESEIEPSDDSPDGATVASARSPSSLLLTPLAFPLTVGGATFGVLVGFAATVNDVGDRFVLTGAGLGYAAVTGVTLYLSGRVHRYASPRARALLDRIAGILLTAIAVTLLASGGTRLVADVLDSIGR